MTEVDHHDHEAVVAVDPETGRSVAVALYIQDREGRDSAEIAVSVLESWQGRGVGKALMRALADREREEGITRFTALMLAHNRPMRQLLAYLGPPRVLSTGAGAVELAVDLPYSTARKQPWTWSLTTPTFCMNAYTLVGPTTRYPCAFNCFANTSACDVDPPADYLSVFFAGSDTSRAAGQQAAGRIFGARTVDRDTPTSWQTRLAQYDAVCAWGQPNHSLLERVSAIDKPVFVANGDSDPMILPRYSYLLAGLIPDARLKIYPDAAHGFLFQHHAEFAADVEAFLDPT